MKKIIFVTLFVFILSACATSPRVKLLVDNFKGTEKKIVMLSDSQHLRELRIELRKLGFQMPKFSQYDEEKIIKTENTQKGSVSYQVRTNRPTARYGIEVVKANYLDRCIAGDSLKYNITLEISDLYTNEVVAYITNGGWTEPCFPSAGGLYKNLAKQIDDLWKSKYKTIEVEE